MTLQKYTCVQVLSKAATCPWLYGLYFVSRQMLPESWPSGSDRRFCDGHNRKVDGSTPTQASLLHFWIRCFTTIISAWWNLTSSKLKKSETKFKRKARKQRQLLSESGFVLNITPPPLSRDRRMKKSNRSKLERCSTCPSKEFRYL